MNKIFSKDKDWVLLIGYVSLIYSTLQFMPNITSFFSSLSDRHFGITVNILVSAIIIAIFIMILKRNPQRTSPIFYIFVITIFGSYAAILFLATPIVAEKIHLLEYGLLSYLALRAVKNVKSYHMRYLLVVLIIIVVGYCDELIQKFTPGRYYELRDVILNAVSGVLGLFVLKLLKPNRYSYD